MALASSNDVVGEESASKGAVDGCPHPVLISVADHVTEVPIHFQPFGLGHTCGRIQESIGHIDHVKHAGINELPHLVCIVAPADEAHVPGFAVPQHPLQTFQRPTGPQIIFDPELGI